MARKRVARSLPDLPKRLTLGPREHKTERLLEILRHLALAAQTDQPRAFYSMREIGHRFKAPISTVSRIYRLLEREGILSRIRGSKTTLRGLKYDRKLTVRAFVGLPASISKFVTIQDYRMFFIHTRRQLRLNGFATAMLFLDQSDAEDLAIRAQRYEIDTTIWFQPGQLAKQSYPRLKDLGIRMVNVSDGELPSLPCRYEVHRENATRAILRDWHSNASLKSVVVVSAGGRGAAADEQRLQHLLEEERFEYKSISANSESISRLLESLSQKQNTGIIFLSSAASMSAFRAPEIVSKIFARCRVALVAGAVNMPFATVPNVNVDLVVIDWLAIAKRIVKDLISQRSFDGARPVVFEARAQLQVPLSNYAQAI
jgi:hypothetical protein